MLTDGRGVLLGVVVAGDNTNDFKLVRQTFDSMLVPQPEPTKDNPQHLCLDAGYDYQQVRSWGDKFGLILHIRPQRPPKRPHKRNRRKNARRWVVERSYSFFHRFRRLLVRWEKREDTYLAMIHLAAGIINWSHSLLPK